jgi:shikimate kinase
MPLRAKILLIGQSGAGKSALLGKLQQTAPAAELRLEDLDHLVLGQWPQYGSLQDLIQQQGWEVFREAEVRLLQQWLARPEPGVLALGGGSWEELSRRGINLPTNQVRICLLAAPFTTCWQRLQAAHHEPRPLLQLGPAAYQSIFNSRERLFGEIAWVLYNPEGTDLDQLAASFWREAQA